MAARAAVIPVRPEVLAFLTASKENPGDDTPRLVLADWLEEHGDARGELVRLQCQRAARGDETPAAKGSREAELLKRHWAAWLGVLDEKGIRADMHRGLVKVWGTCRKLLSKRLASIREHEPLAWVDHLSLTDPLAEDLTKLVASPHWTCLTRLDFRRYVYHSDHLIGPESVGRSSGDWSALANLALLARLTALDFSCQDMGADGLEVLAARPDLGRLRTLDLACNNLGDGGAATLVGAQSLTGLNVLNLTHNRLRVEGFAALAGWSGLGTVTSLALGQNYPGDEGVRALAGSPWLGNLTELSLHADPSFEVRPSRWEQFGPRRIGPVGAAALAGAKSLSRLTRLDLGNNQIGAEGAAALAASTALPALAELDLGDNEIGDAGAIALAASPTMSNLKTLSLRYNGLSDRGAEALAGSPYLSGVTELDCRANRDITSRGTALLKKRFGKAVDVQG
jgi:uncharacterized protein (TIGR02996 family)